VKTPCFKSSKGKHTKPRDVSERAFKGKKTENVSQCSGKASGKKLKSCRVEKKDKKKKD